MPVDAPLACSSRYRFAHGGKIGFDTEEGPKLIYGLASDAHVTLVQNFFPRSIDKDNAFRRIGRQPDAPRRDASPIGFELNEEELGATTADRSEALQVGWARPGRKC